MSDYHEPVTETVGASHPNSASMGVLRKSVWFVSASIAVTAATVVMTNAPIRLKLPILFSFIWGMLLGWGLFELKQWWRCGKWNVLTSIIAGLMILCSQIGVTWGWYLAYLPGPQEREQRLLTRLENDPTQGLVSQFMKEDGKNDDAQTAVEREKFRKELERVKSIRQKRLDEVRADLTFPGYLRFRLSQIVDCPPPLPMIGWILEIVMGSIAGAWVPLWLSRNNSAEASASSTGPVKPQNPPRREPTDEPVA